MNDECIKISSVLSMFTGMIFAMFSMVLLYVLVGLGLTYFGNIGVVIGLLSGLFLINKAMNYIKNKYFEGE